MMPEGLSRLVSDRQSLDKKAFVAFSVVLLASLAVSIYYQDIRFLALPLGVIFLLVLLLNYSLFFYALMVAIPFSKEVSIPGGFSTDLFSEPLMLVLMGCFIGTVLLGRFKEKAFYTHPVIIIMLMALLWAIIAMLFSVDMVKSVKYMLAKTWYIFTFVFVTATLLSKPADIKKIVWPFLIALTITVLYTIVRHAQLHFSFEHINLAIQPFYKNHVIYAATIALAIPYVFYLIKLSSGKRKTQLILAGILSVLLIGVILAYTRASWLSIPVAIGYYVIIRFRAIRQLLFVGYIAVAGLVFYFINENRYLQFAPDYDTTIFYGHDLEKHLEATYNMQDLSGMERIYRWVAGSRMIAEKPWTGSGPSTFYPEYKKFTLSTFRTYVSRNPEQSTAHNYFLLQLAEQGIPGFLLFMALITYLLVLPERLYHQTKNKEFRYIILAASLSLVIIIFHLLLNELIEVDKIGSFFYISIALLIKADIWIKKENRELAESGL